MAKAPCSEEVQQFLQDSGIKDSAAEILGPFSDTANRLTEALWSSVPELYHELPVLVCAGPDGADDPVHPLTAPFHFFHPSRQGTLW